MEGNNANFFASPRMKRKNVGPQSPSRQTEKPLLTQLFEKKYENSKDVARQMVEATLAVEETKFNPNPSPYEIEVKLGSGVFSEVFSAITHDGGPYALKRISKKNPKFSWKLVLREIAAGKKLQHKGIVRFRDHFETANNVYLVMDYFAGRDLYTLMEQTEFRPLDEPLAKHLFRQLIDAIGYAHQEGVCHRDIKLENVLVNSGCELKVIDFGLCAVQADGYCSDYVGTADYAAPEVLLREPYNGFKADVWSCGVFLYAILYGEFPFDLDEFLVEIKEGNLPELSWGLENPAFKSATEDAKDILQQIFTVDPKKRPSISDLKQHPWLQTEENVEKLCAPFFEMAVSGVE